MVMKDMAMKKLARPMLGLTFAAACVLAAEPALAEDYVIGAELALTGTYAWVGVPSREGLDVGIEEVNASDLLGGHKLKVLIEDTGSDKTQAISLINRFSARDMALMVLGPSSSSEGVAIAPVANELQIPLLTTTAVSEAINKSGPWVFKTPASPALVIGDVAKYAVNKMGVKSVAMVWGRNNDGQVGQKNAALETFKASNTKIVAEESVLTSDTDFLAVITKIIATKPDAVFLALVAEQSANFIIQARQQGIDPAVKFLGVPNFGSDQFILIGGKAVEGAIYVADYFAGTAGEENQRFVEAYRKKYNRTPDNGAALGYTAVKIAAAALRGAGANPTRDSVRDGFLKIKDFPVILGRGTFNFDGNRGARYEGVIMTVKNGKFVPAPE
jgi:branched-chain amino acid transport system substrate-binding protein